ncbi:RICIN domain-containing protein [Streptacidiphilus pinicola]|uniref:RICIN domain-containing protein n=1 Tax=Streptacidiphilus pinicola TaxID=2219663 RepID=UPI001402FB0F|nr:ricin-type beta-trefoil lectin domain protein [Streptacidiphilus pinicola]
MALALFTGTATAAHADERGRMVNLLTGRCLEADRYGGAVRTGGCGMGFDSLRQLWEVRATHRNAAVERIFSSDGGCLESEGYRTVAVVRSCLSDNSLWTQRANGKLMNAATGRCLTTERFGYVFLSDCGDGPVGRQAWRLAGAR